LLNELLRGKGTKLVGYIYIEKKNWGGCFGGNGFCVNKIGVYVAVWAHLGMGWRWHTGYSSSIFLHRTTGCAFSE